MPLLNIFDVAGSAMSAQSIRLNTIASNLANAETTAATPEAAYRAREPVFAQLLNTIEEEQGFPGVTVSAVIESTAPVPRRYAPNHPLADSAGYVYGSNVNVMEEMANMMSAARSYQNNVEVLNTSKELMLRTLQLGQ